MFGQNQRLAQDREHNGLTLSVQEVFPTLQGEGPDVGTPAVFVRLAGCNLACTFCDTDFESNAHDMDVRALATLVVQQANRIVLPPRYPYLVVLTGGEPLRQNVGPLISMLNTQGYRVQVETAGTLWWDWIPNHFDHGMRQFGNTIVCSPKTARLNHKLLPYITSYKYIVRADGLNEYGLPNESTQVARAVPMLAARPRVPADSIFLQPMDEQDDIKNERNVAAAVAACRKFGYRLSLQTHKLLGLP